MSHYYTSYYSNTHLTEDINWKIFTGSFIFFFISLVNIRDFPVPNVPLIYPAFLLFLLISGIEKFSEGFRRTRYLSILVIVYWSYQSIFNVIHGRMPSPYDIAVLLEPLMIFGVAGMITMHPNGAQSAVWALIVAIVISAAAGLWIYFIGEPVVSFVRTIHSQTGGNILEGRNLGDGVLTVDLLSKIKRNTGLSSRVFGFAFQLSIATTLALTALLSIKRAFNISYLALLTCFFILLVGIVTSAERGPFLAVTVGLFFFLIVERARMVNIKTITAIIVSIGIIAGILHISSTWTDRYTIFNRRVEDPKTFVRTFIMPRAAVESILYEPFGAGIMTGDLVRPELKMTDHYIQTAYNYGWLNEIGPKTPHNHFAGVIMYTGIIGVLLTMALFWGFWIRLSKICRLREGISLEEFIIPFACVTALIHSFFQNAGFFIGEPATQIVFGLLWGTTAKLKYPIYNHLLNRWVIS